MKASNSNISDHLSSKTSSLVEAIGKSESFLTFQERLSNVAPIERPVILIGERGTGKELAAIRLHYLSQRWQKPFVTLNCAALAPTLVESELFGHEAGAFTGAAIQKKGRFEEANHGTLFLDEIGNMPLQVQEKILRIIEYGVFERVGSSQHIHVNVRLIAATNANLPELAAKGQFKRDLLDRLSFEVLHIPPLRDREEDILLLAEYFARRMSIELNRSDVPNFTKSVKNTLTAYHWPGNIRECKNTIERAVYQCESNVIENVEFDPFQSIYTEDENHISPPDIEMQNTEQRREQIDLKIHLKDAIRNLELNYLTEVLHRSKHNQKKAAKLLGMTYNQFRGLYRKYYNTG